MELLDWTAKLTIAGKPGATPEDTPTIFARLSLDPMTWTILVRDFGRMVLSDVDPRTIRCGVLWWSKQSIQVKATVLRCTPPEIEVVQRWRVTIEDVRRWSD